MSENLLKIRNFSIIAHIDHGKSTLSDRLIQMCNGLEEREMKAQVLDSMDIERERGITIKAQTVRLKYKAKDGDEYILNLIDTPGHVDFTYEVSRSLAACEGSILLVDATQGVEAQTVANAYKAIETNHEIIPVLNKVDLQSSDVEKSKKQIEDIIGIDASNAICISAKTGIGIDEVLEAIIKQIPAPKSNLNLPKALLIDAWYDVYLGVILLIRMIDGSLNRGNKIKTLSNLQTYSIESLGFFTPKKLQTNAINAGEIGYITANIKNVKDCNIGDTIVLESDNQTEIMDGFQKIKPVVFCSIYPIDVSEYSILKEAIDKLLLNDSSVSYELESSNALGIGFRCGFLGLLHLEVFCERISREFDIEIITTSPSVVYRIYLKKDLGKFTEIANPIEMPDPSFIDKIEEPYALLTIFSQEECVGDIIKLCQNKRGEQQSIEFSQNRAIIKYKIPTVEIISEFHDKLKSISKGYASHEYEFCEYRDSDIVKVIILLNSDEVEALSFMTHRSNSERKGRAVCEKLKEVIPQHMFAVPIQAAIGGKIIARETISALRKDVTAKCYGGDISRKKKLLEKQKEGKKKMKMIGSVEVPKEAFLKILTVD